ncbi:hypothetical protein K1F50_16135 [Muricauda oceani]|uniref:Uncharacterized protein n=1 Tax=Flagellimonas oceani TaxID=2698672 RepID=A0A6G7IY33_9FLAO|nr:hypothetical protein [Allomuricauda oceani]MBW8244339.1 hypothetical protein [Allomuricauda oceani]QII43248.1 hypothetical protein GVT53_00590 [Allomuricauda oceani]
MSFLHMGIAATPIILGILFYFNSEDPQFNPSGSEDMFLAIVPVVALASIFLGDFIFKKILGSASQKNGLREKLGKFQTASILKYVLLEGASLFSMVIFSNTQNLVHLILGIVLILYLFLQLPTKQKIESALDLKGAEKAKFDRTHEPVD